MKNKAFSIIELLIVIAIIAILASILLPWLNRHKARLENDSPRITRILFWHGANGLTEYATTNFVISHGGYQCVEFKDDQGVDHQLYGTFDIITPK